MVHGLLLLADGFETTEALATLDVLLRSKRIELTTVSLNEDRIAYSNFKIPVACSVSIGEVEAEPYSFMILPGGKLGVDNLKSNAKVQTLIDKFISLNLPIYAICAAPSILAAKGYYECGDYTCFPGFQGGKGNYTGEEVVKRKGKITARSMAYSIPFGEAILEELFGEEAVLAVRKGTRGLA